MYKYETLAMDGDGNYFAIFKNENNQFDRLIYDYQGLTSLIETESFGDISHNCLSIARARLYNQINRRNQKERAI